MFKTPSEKDVQNLLKSKQVFFIVQYLKYKTWQKVYRVPLNLAV